MNVSVFEGEHPLLDEGDHVATLVDNVAEAIAQLFAVRYGLFTKGHAAHKAYSKL